MHTYVSRPLFSFFLVIPLAFYDTRFKFRKSKHRVNYLIFLKQILVLVAFLLVDVAHTGPLRQSAMNNNPIILSYKTDTHSRHETGIPGRSVQGSYRLVRSHDCGFAVSNIIVTNLIN